MSASKILKIDEKMERLLTNVCDAALKFQGLQIMNTVVEVAQAIRLEEQPAEAAV